MSLLAVTSGSNGSTGSSVGAPEGVDFDGVNDYLSRSTDLVGNVDSKTFTFSAWVYLDSMGRANSIIDSGTGIRVSFSSNGYFNLVGLDSVGANAISMSTTSTNINLFFNLNSWNNILISFDMSNTTLRKVFINDRQILDASLGIATYVNTSLSFTGEHCIGAYIGGANKLKGRLSNLFLDYTYRDLSIEANRRLFITADGKPT